MADRLDVQLWIRIMQLSKSSLRYDQGHRELSPYAKEKLDRFHVYGADRSSYLSNGVYYPT